MREPNGEAALALFQAAYEGQVTLHISSLSFSYAFYTLRKQFGAQPARELLRKLAQLVAVTTVDAAVVQAALALEFADIEDAMQHFATAGLPEVETLVTGDLKGFKAGHLRVLSPREAQLLLSK
ncbi:PIN domain-containing protein [Hymenobacter weizhouensis]|uniref:PIN domain-containing protein n=1 Tax=Hymenobacter sp. YIM 151500-1 TaxID=2987689 RepID=UPI002226EA02|nr:PIN domain-containing protein [Hymenobacter sp. YIM 151500-1]UYZ61606.1 hypothetical protein OIS53_11370 [Hymenobacter sp. YIM 151500-1]